MPNGQGVFCIIEIDQLLLLDRRVVQRGFSGGSQQIEFMTDDLLHSFDAGRIDVARFADIGVFQHFTALLIEGILDVAGNVDLVDAAACCFCDLLILIGGTAVQHQRNGNQLFDILGTMPLG